MNPQDRAAIDGIFDRLGQVATQGTRDSEAEAVIRSRMDAQPGAAYYLAQTVVVQDQALQAAQTRIQELEKSSSGGAHSQAGAANTGGGAFGDTTPLRAPAGTAAGSVPAVEASKPGLLSKAGFGRSAPSGGGGFLAGAAQTAMGVAGGMMLGSMLGGLFGSNDAQAASAPEPQAAAEEPAADDASYDDGGGFDDGGSFDDI